MNEVSHEQSSIVDLTKTNDLVEDFMGFVAERMDEPEMGQIELYTQITPDTERQRRDNIINIRA